jgi:hypothetical protein
MTTTPSSSDARCYKRSQNPRADLESRCALGAAGLKYSERLALASASGLLLRDAWTSFSANSSLQRAQRLRDRRSAERARRLLAELEGDVQRAIEALATDSDRA